jgi:tRNA(Ile2) C34 agmatinyltransferase TiaS
MNYGGVKYTKVRHAIQCKKCLETIESKGIHDYKSCSCNSVAIDDGRILGNSSDFEDRSVYRAIIKNKIVYFVFNISL